MGLAFDDWDLEYYTNLFKEDMKRDPTNVELFDIAQSNSEHSRHWFFRWARHGNDAHGAAWCHCQLACAHQHASTCLWKRWSVS